MKNQKLICYAICFASLLIISCKKELKHEEKLPEMRPMSQLMDAPLYSMPIGIDSANQMIASYLNGINYTVNTNEIRSFSYNADVLRDYLNTTPGSVIKELKFMLAHNVSYAFSENYGIRPDSNQNVLTFIIVGIDENGDYTFLNNNQVMDFCSPCPVACFGRGSAVSDFLVKNGE